MYSTDGLLLDIVSGTGMSVTSLPMYMGMLLGSQSPACSRVEWRSVGLHL